jgi:hypothetical protein
VHPWEAPHEHGGLGEAAGAPDQREEGDERNLRPKRRVRHHRDPGQGEQPAREGTAAQPLLPLQNGEKERDERN